MSTEHIKIEANGNELQLIAQGAFTVKNSAVIKSLLKESLTRTGDETLHMANVDSLDVAGIQLAYAWKKSLEKQGRRATVQLPSDANLKDLLEKTGITKIL